MNLLLPLLVTLVSSSCRSVNAHDQSVLLQISLKSSKIVDRHAASSESKANPVHNERSILAQGNLSELRVEPSLLPPIKVHTTVERCILFVSFFALAAYAAWAVFGYEGANDEFDQPWFHDTQCLTQVLGAMVGCWMIVGIFFFTEILLFMDYERHLTLSEALYVNAQIITTIGYGELTPSGDYGCFFMMVYAATAVLTTGVFFQHFVLLYFEKSKFADLSLRRALAPVVVCWLFGTFFFAFYPGEDKTIFECMYMSVITFLTIGFGDYHPETEVGRAIGAVWMVLGVVVTGKAVLDGTCFLYYHRRNLCSQAATLHSSDQTKKDVASLSGAWISNEHYHINVQALHCHFGKDDTKPSEIVLSDTNVITLDDWILLGFNEDRTLAYWRKDAKIAHWCRQNLLVDESNSDRASCRETKSSDHEEAVNHD